MPKITVEQYEEIPNFPADSIVHVKVDDMRVRDVNGRDGNTWQKLEFTFKIEGIQYVPVGQADQYQALLGGKIYGSVPFRLTENPDNKLKQWTEAILGIELSAGFELDTDLLIGRSCRAITSVYDKKAINSATGKPYQGHQVASLLPRAEGGNFAAAPQPQQNWTNGQNQAPAPQPQQQDPWMPPAQPQQQPAAAGLPFGGYGGTTYDEPPF